MPLETTDVDVSERGLALIREFEGCKLAPYLCPAGVWTVGYGHTFAAETLHHVGLELTQAQVNKLLAWDVARAAKAVREMVKVPLTQGQVDALVSFVFNFGENKLYHSTLLKKLNASDFKGAAGEFGKWVYSGKPPKALPGLTRRREAERKLFEGAA